MSVKVYEMLLEKVAEMKREDATEEQIIEAMKQWREEVWYRDW